MQHAAFKILDVVLLFRFGQKFVDRVANPRDVVLFMRRKAAPRSTGGGGDMGEKL